MIWESNPGSLTWDEVDPARHPFDRSAASRVVGALGPAQRVPRRPDVPYADPAMTAWRWGEAMLWADAMSQALVRQYGRWVLGWRWSHDEGDFDGGPIGTWYSITTPEETLACVVTALDEWRAWLEDLAGWFDAYPLDLARVPGDRILWESTARYLILQVADRTGGGSGWHRHCRQVLTWFLERWGVDPDIAGTLVEEAIGGRFRSWSGPDPVLVSDVAEQLAGSLRPDVGVPPARPSGPATDHLRRWLTVREAVPWAPEEESDGAVGGPVVPSSDGAAEDIRAFDGVLDPARARGMLAALELVRTDAARGARLDFELVRNWQQHVLGAERPPPFRSLPAFAKAGRERYGIGPDTRADLDRCLAESKPGGDCDCDCDRNCGGGRRLSLTARAARAYLDVCFFHPFDDGNARAAFLTLVFVLAREDVALDGVSLLRRITFQADDPQDALALVRYIDIHLAETRRRAVAEEA